MGPFHPYGLRERVPPTGARTDVKAVVSLVLGLMSLGFLGPVLGLPAIILGAVARRDIDRSNGVLTGHRVAAGGIVSGLFGTGFGVVVTLWVLGAVFAPESPETKPTTEDAAASPSEPALAAAPPPVVTTTPGVHAYGSLEVVDLDDSRSLRPQLVAIATTSLRRKRTIVLQTYVRSNTVCDDITAALSDERMQRALADVTLVRVNVDEYDRELQQMKVETATAPWFYKIDPHGNPGDAISARAWEEANAPENMAMVLGSFVARPPRKGRRHHGAHAR